MQRTRPDKITPKWVDHFAANLKRHIEETPRPIGPKYLYRTIETGARAAYNREEDLRFTTPNGNAYFTKTLFDGNHYIGAVVLITAEGSTHREFFQFTH